MKTALFIFFMITLSTTLYSNENNIYNYDNITVEIRAAGERFFLHKQTEEMVTGTVVKYGPGGMIFEEYALIDGKLNGTSKEYYFDGNIKYEIAFDNGNRHGITRQYYPNGVIFIETLYNRNFLVERKIFYENSKPWAEYYYKEGIFDNGTCISPQGEKIDYDSKYVSEFYPNTDVRVCPGTAESTMSTKKFIILLAIFIVPLVLFFSVLYWLKPKDTVKWED